MEQARSKHLILFRPLSQSQCVITFSVFSLENLARYRHFPKLIMKNDVEASSTRYTAEEQEVYLVFSKGDLASNRHGLLFGDSQLLN